MSVQEATVVNAEPKDESESDLKKQQLLTEDEGAFKGPKFSPPVYRRRYAAVCELAKKHQAKKVLDFGCAEAKLVKILTNQETLPHLEEVVGIDINKDLLEMNKFRINPLIADYLRPRTHPFKVSLYQGSIAEADERFVDFDLIACVELIEHLESDILNAMPEALFGQLSPKLVIVTTPNVEFNVLFPGLKGFRHYDHKFEWTRAEFEEWCNCQASKYHYTVTFDGIASGPEGSEHLGCCSQVAVFERISSSATPTKESGICQPYNLIAAADYPFREDTRTEEEKILFEVEYVLWVLTSKLEEESDDWDEANDELTSSDEDCAGAPDDEPTLSDEDYAGAPDDKLTPCNEDYVGAPDEEPTPSDEDYAGAPDDKPTPSDKDYVGAPDEELIPSDKDCAGAPDDELTPSNEDYVGAPDDELTPSNEDYVGAPDDEPTPSNEDYVGAPDDELSPSNKDCAGAPDDEPTPSNEDYAGAPDDELTPSNKDYVDAHVGKEPFGNCTNDRPIEDDKGCVYSLEKLFSFPSLSKLCGNIQKLKGVLQDSSMFHLTEDGCGVLWRKPSQHWSSDESDNGWDVCADDQRVEESNTTQDSAWVKDENWDDDSDDDACTASHAHTLNTAIQPEVCWDSSNDCCKFWNGEDWGELEESGALEEVEEEFSTNLHYRDNVTIVQESDGSLSNDSGDNDLDDLVWISDNSKANGEDIP